MKKSFILLILVFTAVGLLFFIKNNDNGGEEFISGQLVSDSTPTPSSVENEKDGFKTFVFDNFHGDTDISDKFQFQYPADWFNEGQYFSPRKIQWYTKYEVKAPIWFDLVLAEIFDYTELKYKIDNSKRRTADAVGKIGGKEFKRYDLIDYGTYGGESAGHVKIFMGPKIKIDGTDYILVFHWEEKPLAENMPGNSIDVFDNMLLTLKFFQ